MGVLRRFGQLEVDSQQIIGNGSDGTTVFVGYFEGKKVAVKRIVQSNFALANTEVCSALAAG
jgi:serine/threonine-protein kinase/endoribonuclease IRE1